MKTNVLWVGGLALLLSGGGVLAQGNSNTRGPEGEGCINDANLGPDGEWRCFDWPGDGGGDAPAGVVVPSIPIFLTGPYKIEVTDCYCAGDVFQVRVDGVVIGTTSAVPDEDDCVPSSSDFDACFASPDFTKGTFYIGSGTHEIQVEVIQDPFGGGTGGIRAFAQPTQAIPTLGQWGLAALVAALAGASLLLLRRRRAA